MRVKTTPEYTYYKINSEGEQDYTPPPPPPPPFPRKEQQHGAFPPSNPPPPPPDTVPLLLPHLQTSAPITSFNSYSPLSSSIFYHSTTGGSGGTITTEHQHHSSSTGLTPRAAKLSILSVDTPPVHPFNQFKQSPITSYPGGGEGSGGGGLPSSSTIPVVQPPPLPDHLHLPVLQQEQQQARRLSSILVTYLHHMNVKRYANMMKSIL